MRNLRFAIPATFILMSIAVISFTIAADDPLSGTWTGDWGPSERDRNQATVELKWDGKALTGTVNPGPNLEMDSAGLPYIGYTDDPGATGVDKLFYGYADSSWTWTVAQISGGEFSPLGAQFPVPLPASDGGLYMLVTRGTQSGIRKLVGAVWSAEYDLNDGSWGIAGYNNYAFGLV